MPENEKKSVAYLLHFTSK